MPGTVLTVPVAPGDAVEQGDPLIVLEAMKMEVAIAAPVAGVVRSIEVEVGDRVANQQLLATLE